MIIFHEGLPRSGKSYEACVSRIIPALQSGRKVFTNIDGLNHDKFAELTGKAVEEIKVLLVQLSDSDVKKIYEKVEDDSLVLIDELQDHFPLNKQPLPELMTSFVTQHGHRGIDIVAMGQDLRDCHMLWKRRVDQKIVFVKRDAIGKPDSYTWTTYKQKEGKFIKLRSGSGNYDQKYFGLYKSHVDTAMNKETYQDDRSNIFKSKIFTAYMPFMLLLCAFSIYYLYGFFHKKTDQTQQNVQSTKSINSQPVQPIQPVQQNQNQPVVETPPPTHKEDDYLLTYLDKYRARLSGIIENRKTGKMTAWVEFLDDQNKVYERLNVDQVKALGLTVVRRAYGLMLVKGNNQYVVTAFPVDRSENVTREDKEDHPQLIASNNHTQSR